VKAHSSPIPKHIIPYLLPSAHGEPYYPKNRFFTRCAIRESLLTQEGHCFIQAWVLGGFSTNQAHSRLVYSLHLYIKFMSILSIYYIFLLINISCAAMWCHCSWLLFRPLCACLHPSGCLWFSLMVFLDEVPKLL